MSLVLSVFWYFMQTQANMQDSFVPFQILNKQHTRPSRMFRVGAGRASSLRFYGCHLLEAPPTVPFCPTLRSFPVICCGKPHGDKWPPTHAICHACKWWKAQILEANWSKG